MNHSLVAFALIVGFLAAVMSQLDERTHLNLRPGNEIATSNPPVAPYHFFDVDLTIQATNLARLREQPRQDVVAICRIGGHQKFEVELHLKGTGSFEPIDGRPSLTVKPKRNDRQQCPELFTSKFYLHNNKQDPSLLRDMLARTIYRQMGVPVPDLGYAHVTLNGRNLGFYTVCEGIGKNYLRKTFGTTRGELFEGEIEDYGRYPGLASPKAGEARGRQNFDVSHLSYTVFNQNNLRSFIAAEYVSAHKDGWLFNQNNYWIYRLPDSGPAYAFPHTMDSVFRRNAPIVTFPSEARIPKAFLEVESERQQVLAIVRKHSGPTNLTFLLQTLNLHGSNLLKEIASREPAKAMERCGYIQKLEEIVTNHFVDINAALDIEFERADSWGRFTQPNFWSLGPGNRSGKIMPDHDEGKLIGVAMGNPATLIIECPVIVRKGSYRFTAWLKSGNPKNKESQRQEASVAVGRFGSTTGLIGMEWEPMEHDFSVTTIPSGGLFNLERVTLRVQVTNLVGTLLFDVGRTTLTRKD